jgi:uncharacterized membrane protein YukC
MDFIIAVIIFSIVGFCLYLNKYFAIFILILCSLIGGFSYINRYFGLENNNAIEEAIEMIIKENFDLEIDLTPESPEAHN